MGTRTDAFQAQTQVEWIQRTTDKAVRSLQLGRAAVEMFVTLSERLAEVLRCCEPLRWVGGRCPGDGVVKPFRRLRVVAFWMVGLGRVGKRLPGSCAVWQIPTETKNQRHAQRVNVRPCIPAIAGQHFGCCIRNGPHDSTSLCHSCEPIQSGGAEVNQAGVALGIEQDVVWFYVAVQHTAPVRRV